MAKKKLSRATDFFVKNNFNLKEIQPLTNNQKLLFDFFDTKDHLFISGVPGSGKTFLSLYKAFDLMNNTKCSLKKIVIIRSVVPSRDAGFLPGSIEEKAAIYEAPYEAICSELFGRDDAYKIMTERDVIEFTTTSYLRGITFKNCLIIVDELQNMSFAELNTIISRVGDNCRIIFCGDYLQTDLNRKRNDQSGFIKFMNILKKIPDFGFIVMAVEDIVRSSLVKKYILARIDYEEHNDS